MIKLIVSDMDGTLLDDNKKLPPNFEEVYKQLKRDNIEFVVASGRPIYSLRTSFNHFKNNITFIADNGAYIGLKPEPIIVDSFTLKDVLPIIDEVRKHPELNIIICTEQIAYIENKTWEFYTTAYQYYKNLAMVRELDFIEDPILKIAIYNADTWNEKKQYNFGGLDSQFNFSLSGHYWTDIMPKGVEKGSAVEKLQEQLGVKPSETMVFGDFLNDLEMMTKAQYSYAMKNAHPDIKRAASYEAPSNNEHGVTQIIIEQVLQNKK